MPGHTPGAAVQPGACGMLLVLFVTVMFAACVLQGILGSGSALVAVPLALLFLPKETVVSSSLMVRVSVNGYVSLPFP